MDETTKRLYLLKFQRLIQKYQGMGDSLSSPGSLAISDALAIKKAVDAFESEYFQLKDEFTEAATKSFGDVRKADSVSI